MKKNVLFAALVLMASIGSGSLFAEELKVGFSFAKPPYVCAAKPFQDKFYNVENDNLGIEIELFREALAGTGYTFKPVYSPYKRIIVDLSAGKLDAAETSGPEEPGIYYSKPIIGCENYAITKKADNLTINSIQDLKDLSIVAWQGAMTDLGPDFAEAVRDNSNYHENPDQRAQYTMFRNGRVKVIVIDKYIFQWWDKELSSNYKASMEYVHHPVFPGVNKYRMGFRDEKIKNIFNEGLSRIKNDGTWDRVFIKYMGDVKK